METFVYKIRRHWITIAASLIFGILMVLPFFYFQAKLGNNFKGILPEIVNDENFYYARVKDITDGHPFLSNAYLYEHKNGLPQQLFLAEWLLAQPIKIFNLNINTAHIIYNFLLPAVAFILAYLALFLVSRSRFLSIIFSVFLFFGLYPLVLIRPVSPQFNFIFWLTQFILLWLLIENQKSFKILFLNILNFGLLFYIYPYYWTFYLIFFGFLVAVYFWGNRELAFKIAAIAAGGLILAIPYFYFNYLSARLPYYAETLTRLGMIYTHFPSGIRIIFYTVFGLALFGLALWKKIIHLDAKAIFFISGILASVIAVNQHLLTGKNFEFSSHYEMGAIFFLVFAVAYLMSKYNANLKIILSIIVFIFSALGIRDYSQRAFAIEKNAIERQNYAPIFEWLNKNTEKDSVVYANADLSRLIPVYTANNIFYVREANLFFISDTEVFDRFALNNFFEDFNKDFIVENERAIFGVRYIDAYGHIIQGNKLRRLLGIKPELEIGLPDKEMAEVINRAKELQGGDFIKELKKYKIDYLIWDKNKNPNWKINLNFFSGIYSMNNIVIYRIK